MENRTSRPGAASLDRHASKLTHVLCLVVLWALVSFDPARAHPHGQFDIVNHEHPALGLIISIEEDRVVYDVSVSNGFLNTLVPCERGHLKLRLEKNTFVFLDPDQEKQQRELLETFFSQLPPLRIDGASVPPEFDGFTFVRSSASADLAISATLPPDARIRIRFPASTPPKQVELAWDVFADAYSVDAFGDPIKPKLAARLDTRSQSRIVNFTAENPTVRWSAPKKLPDKSVVAFDPEPKNTAIPLLSIVILAAGCCGWALSRRTQRTRRIGLPCVVAAVVMAFLCRNAGGIPVHAVRAGESPETFGDTATNTFESLLTNIYRAFDYRQESDVYDVLAQSVDGPLLASVYKEIHRTLIAADQGNAVAKVKSVEILRTDLIEPTTRENNEIEIRGQWRVEGMVYHWGHVHDTSNIYEANYTIAPRNGFWKIIRTETMRSSPDG